MLTIVHSGMNYLRQPHAKSCGTCYITLDISLAVQNLSTVYNAHDSLTASSQLNVFLESEKLVKSLRIK